MFLRVAVRSRLRRYFALLGPGLVTGAADDDPSGVTTYSMVGASMGYDLLWTAALSTPLMIGVQLMCARIGLATGKGIIGAVRGHTPRWVPGLACLLLLLANGFNIGADLAGMAEVTELLTDFPRVWLIPFYGVLILVVLVFANYQRIARQLKWLTLSLFAYVGAAFLAHPDWWRVASAAVVPTVHFNSVYWLALVATLGTTISPYLFFWQASQEVEELQLLKMTGSSAAAARDRLLREANADVATGMVFSNVVMFFIIVATASTLHVAGIRDIQTARQAAEALRPLVGDAAYVLYALGILGTGFLAIPVLVSSASYAVAELFQWRTGLDVSLFGARPFDVTLTGGILVGIALNLGGVSAVETLFWSAVVNGVLAPPLLVLVLFVANNRSIMGAAVNGRTLNVLGGISVIVMTAAAVALLLA